MDQIEIVLDESADRPLGGQAGYISWTRLWRKLSNNSLQFQSELKPKETVTGVEVDQFGITYYTRRQNK